MLKKGLYNPRLLLRLHLTTKYPGFFHNSEILLTSNNILVDNIDKYPTQKINKMCHDVTF